MKYLKRILITIFSLFALVVLIMIGLYFRGQQLPPKEHKGKIIAKEEPITIGGTGMITVEFDGYRFKFPSNYGGGFPRDGIVLETYWPEFAGKSRKKKTPEEIKPRLYDYLVIIIGDICIGNPPITEKRRQEMRIFEQANYKRNYFEPVFNKKLGLLEYLSRRNNEAEIFVMDQPEVLSPVHKEKMVVYCRGRICPNQEEETIGCQSVYALRPNLCVTVRFYKKHLRDWRAIHAKVLDFIETSMKTTTK